MTTTSTIIYLNAPTHFPIRLIESNFPVWQCQVHDTLVGHDLYGYVDGTTKPPWKFTDAANTVLNLTYSAWYKQDSTFNCWCPFRKLFGDYSAFNLIDPHRLWSLVTISTSYASDSQGRVIYLKSKLTNNPKGNRNIAEYLGDMRSISGALTAAQSPVSENDLIVHVLSQLGDDYASIVPAICVQKSGLTYGDLTNILSDHERMLKHSEDQWQSLLVTADVT